MTEKNEWKKARKKSVIIEFREVRGEKETIRTLEGILTGEASIHYIIRGREGELYPIRKDIFEKTYEVLQDD